MSVYKRFASEGFPSFVTTNCYERKNIFVSSTAATLLVRTLYEVREEAGLLLLAFAIMPDHVHLILVSPATSLGRAMQLIKGRFTHRFNQHRRKRGALWQSRYQEQTIRSERALSRAVEYVHSNPVAADLAAEPEDYRWSSASGRYETDLLTYLGQAEA